MTDDLRNNLRQSYNQKAAERDKRPIQPWKLQERNAFLSLLQQEQKRSLLEIGAGTGIDGAHFREQGLDVTCIDLSPQMVNMCRQKGLTAYVMDVATLPFPPGSFDAAYSLNCLLHLPKAELPGVLATLNTVLKDEGLFYLGLYGGRDQEGIWPDDSYQPKRFFSFYTDEDLRAVVTEVFDIHSFRRVPYEDGKHGLHFQSLVLRKKEDPC